MGGCDPVIVAFLTDGFMYDARTMSYFVSGCAPGGCETDSVFFAGGPRLPDLKDFVLEAGYIVLSLVTVASPSVTFLLREFSFWSVVLLVLRVVCLANADCTKATFYFRSLWAIHVPHRTPAR